MITNSIIEENMLISIITAVYNAEDTIAETIQSVREGGYDHYEHIIIDGGSTDGTLDVVRSMQHDRLRWVSEKDEGIYDAMNKGIGMAGGDYIATLNADDYYVPGALEEVARAIEKSNGASVVHGNIMYLKNGREMIHTPPITKRVYNEIHMPSLHPATFIKSDVYERYGSYNLDYKIAADHDYLMNLYIHKEGFYYLNKVVTCMRWGGASIQQWKLQHKEQRKIHRKYGVAFMKRLQFERLCLMAQIRSFVKSILVRR
ncbi:MAG: glycosyltransferase [Verrucomicrobiae bacterium]|nr:glycosyltransferase [Verrucomicrobiae bacterium]NNJ42520.1 glycosyltransferase [Akkermansiaceae bacterium]